MLTFGEGWHNNHHAHPVSMRHGLAWYEIDMNYIGIKTLQFFGLAWDLKAAELPKHATKVRAGIARRRRYQRSSARPRRLTHTRAGVTRDQLPVQSGVNSSTRPTKL